MDQGAQNFNDFYAAPSGKAVRRIIQRQIDHIWPDIHPDELIIGFGHSMPYLESITAQAIACQNQPPQNQAITPWPHEKESANKLAIINSAHLPFPAQSADKALLIHHLEYTQKLRDHLQELWHILKPNGRALIIVPNRHGAWGRAHWCPFGHGTPFSLRQIRYYVHESGFDILTARGALYTPATQNHPVLSLATMWEQLGPILWPFWRGVHIIEIVKPDPPKGTMTRISYKSSHLIASTAPSSA